LTRRAHLGPYDLGEEPTREKTGGGGGTRRSGPGGGSIARQRKKKKKQTGMCGKKRHLANQNLTNESPVTGVAFFHKRALRKGIKKKPRSARVGGKSGNNKIPSSSKNVG